MKGLFFASLLFISAAAFCQSTISGKVVSDKGFPLANASVFIPNSTIGVYTNDKGQFTLSNLPLGKISFVISYIGYQIVTVPIDSRDKQYLVRMLPLDNNLQAVIISTYDKEGWKKWGNVFTNAFIGTSSYAGNCTITNKHIIRFVYKEETKQLLAFANEPLIIENKDLGYQIKVSLVDFTYEFSTGIVDYQTYALFTEMEGTKDEKTVWTKNRLKVYALSLLHFMRSLYAKNFENEGYHIRLVDRKSNTEKQRIQELYKRVFDRITDSLNTNKEKGYDINALVEKSFSRDSLKYYRKIISQDDKTEKIAKKLADYDDIAKDADSNAIILDCKKYMQVTYTRIKEPEEYFAYKNNLDQHNNLSDVVNNANTSRSYPVTELILQQGIPITINENGYFTNADLFMNGFWGWWEKIATKLPYEYEP